MSKRHDFRVHLPGWVTRLFPEAIWLMPAGNNTLYLSFDDGPVPEVTPLVLDILKEKNIKATFFCVGENISKHPLLFERIKKEGHSVGNHTYNHLQGIKYNKKSYLNNIEKANELIASNMFRPPHGLLTRAQYRAVIDKYKVVMWDVISCDYDSALSPKDCFNNVVDFVRDGSIITFHDSVKARENVLAALPEVIDHLTLAGYQFKRIDFPRIFPLKPEETPTRIQIMRNNINKFLKGAS